MKIYLCDLFHNYLGVSTSMFPLNVGYIAAYAKKNFPEIEFEIFKYTNDFISRFKEEKPDVVGFSNYVWSSNLNNKISNWVKSNSFETKIVFGGPNIDYSAQAYESFFKTHPAVDFYILYQGEEAFLNLIKAEFKKENPINGVVFHDGKNVVLGEKLPRIKDLNSIPSPYLEGFLDKFFETNLIPIIETSRGCPYRCTYCCQGISSYNRIEFFDLERVKKEIDYIAKKVKNTNILNLADSNFGMLERDMEITKYFAEVTDKTGYPRKVSANWAKNQTKVFEISQKLKNLNLIISLQSLDETVLKNIKRTNISLPIFREILEKVEREGGMSGTEIILALPGETKQSHLETLRKLFDWNISYIICYNALILEGSELSSQRASGEFKCKTKFRLIDNSYGEYEGIKVFETEEGIRESSTISEEEILYFRPVHWLIQFLWNYRFYYDLLKYLRFLKINPLDYITKLIDEAEEKAPEKVKAIFKEFREEAKNEWFDSPENLFKYYSQPENFKWLKDGNYGKMNGKYIFKVLIEAKEDFEDYLLKIAQEFCPSEMEKEKVKSIVEFLSASIIDFRKGEDFIYPNSSKFNLYMPEEQKKSLQVLLKQYGHPNKNVTLRKMSELMNIKDFFFKIKNA